MISDTQTAFAITFSTPASIDTGSSLFIKDSRVNDDGPDEKPMMYYDE